MKTHEQMCVIEHYVSMAKTAKYYAIRAKRDGLPRVSETYTNERKHYMRQARSV